MIAIPDFAFGAMENLGCITYREALLLVNDKEATSNEFDGQQDPFEAGIGFAVPLKTKEEDFIGKEAAGHGDCVHVGRSQIGVITSGCLSTTLNKNIALCRIDAQYSSEGTEVEVGKIDGHQKRITAKVVGFPHFDPKKTRVRS